MSDQVKERTEDFRWWIILASDLTGVIFSFFDFKDVCKLCCVSRFFNKLSSDDLVWERLFTSQDFNLIDLGQSPRPKRIGNKILFPSFKERFKGEYRHKVNLPPDQTSISVMVIGDVDVGKSIFPVLFFFITLFGFSYPS